MSPAEELAKQKLNNNRDPRGAHVRSRYGHVKCKLAEIRISLGLNQREVAGAIKVSSATISQMEQGAELVLTNALKVAKFFGKPVEEIWSLIE